MVKRGRPPKMTAEEGLEILEQKQIITESGMTRLQNKMSVKQARKFRRLVRERARQWRTMQERVFTKSLREKGARASRKAKDTPLEGRQRYTIVNGAMGVPVNSRGTILPLVNRYPNGKIFLDLRLWAIKEDDYSTTLTPTRKGITLPMEKLHRLIRSLRALYADWRRSHPGLEQEIPPPSKEFQKLQTNLRQFFQEVDSS